MLEQRAKTYAEKDQTLVFGANTYRLFQRFAPAETDLSNAPLNAARKLMISRTLEEPLMWENSTLIAEDALDAAPHLKADRPSHHKLQADRHGDDGGMSRLYLLSLNISIIQALAPWQESHPARERYALNERVVGGAL